MNSSDNNLVSCSGLKNTIGRLVGGICMENCPMNKSLWSIIILENKAWDVWLQTVQTAITQGIKDQKIISPSDVSASSATLRLDILCVLLFCVILKWFLCLSGRPGGPDNDDDATTQDIWYCSLDISNIDNNQIFSYNHIKIMIMK